MLRRPLTKLKLLTSLRHTDDRNKHNLPDQAKTMLHTAHTPDPDSIYMGIPNTTKKQSKGTWIP